MSIIVRFSYNLSSIIFKILSLLAKFYISCYNGFGASDMRWRCRYAVGGRPLFREEAALLFSSSTTSEGGGVMVTYSDLFQFGILIVGIISLVLQIKKK